MKQVIVVLIVWNNICQILTLGDCAKDIFTRIVLLVGRRSQCQSSWRKGVENSAKEVLNSVRTSWLVLSHSAHCKSNNCKLQSLQIQKICFISSLTLFWLHCKYIRCNFYSFSLCPNFHCNLTVQFTINCCSKYSWIIVKLIYSSFTVTSTLDYIRQSNVNHTVRLQWKVGYI